MPMIFRCDTCWDEQQGGQFADASDFYVECEGCGQDLCTHCHNEVNGTSLCDQCARDQDRDAELEAKKGSE